MALSDLIGPIETENQVQAVVSADQSVYNLVYIMIAGIILSIFIFFFLKQYA